MEHESCVMQIPDSSYSCQPAETGFQQLALLVMFIIVERTANCNNIHVSQAIIYGLMFSDLYV
jgi:hypothetical protein